MLTAVREVQIPVLAAMLLGACCAKLVRTVRTRSIAAGLGPTALFPMRTRKALAWAVCVIEFGLGVGLIITAGRSGAPATCVRIGTGMLFLVATSALVELRASRPDIGCGCFGDFSIAPVSGRTLARSALLAAAALATINLGPLQPPKTAASAIQLLAILAAELIVIGALSPELGEGLVRLGYSEPCELRDVPAERTLAALRRSKQWRKLSGTVTSDVPSDMWRELCWRYVVYPSTYQDRPAQLVFAVFLQQRRPTIHSALVDAATGEPVPAPGSQTAPRPPSQVTRRLLAPLAARLTAGLAARHSSLPHAVPHAVPHADMSLSSDVYGEG